MVVYIQQQRRQGSATQFIPVSPGSQGFISFHHQKSVGLFCQDLSNFPSPFHTSCKHLNNHSLKKFPKSQPHPLLLPLTQLLGLLYLFGRLNSSLKKISLLLPEAHRPAPGNFTSSETVGSSLGGDHTLPLGPMLS